MVGQVACADRFRMPRSKLVLICIEIWNNQVRKSRIAADSNLMNLYEFLTLANLDDRLLYENNETRMQLTQEFGGYFRDRE